MTRSEEFKSEAVYGLRCINTYGYYYIETGERVESVRKFVSALGISSSTLYRWSDNFSGTLILEPDMNKPEPEDFTFELEPEERAITVLSKEEPEILEGWKVAEPETKDMYIKIDNTFLMAFARGLGISNYRAPQSQLYLKVGLELIKKSGLIKNKVIEELSL